MSIGHEFRDGLLVMRMEGSYELDDWIKGLDEALADPRCPDPAPLLSILTESRSIASRSQEEIKRSADAVGRHAERIDHLAAVVAPQDVQFGLMRMAQALVDRYGIDMRVFREEDEALAWIQSSQRK